MAENYYNYLLKLHELNFKLTKCECYDEINLCRYELLAYIEGIPFLYKEFKTKRNNYIQLTKTKKYKNWQVNIENVVKTAQQLYSIEKDLTINVNKNEDFDEIIIKNTQEFCYDFPRFLYFPSLYLLKPSQTLSLNDLKTGIAGFYRKWGNEIFKLFFAANLNNLNVEYFLIDKDIFCFNSKVDKYFLWCLVYTVNKKLQNKINNEISPLNTIKIIPEELPKLTYDSGNNIFLIDENELVLTSSQKNLLCWITGTEDVSITSAVGDIKKQITAQKKINQAFRELGYNGTLIQSKDKKFYINKKVANDLTT